MGSFEVSDMTNVPALYTRHVVTKVKVTNLSKFQTVSINTSPTIKYLGFSLFQSNYFMKVCQSCCGMPFVIVLCLQSIMSTGDDQLNIIFIGMANI